MKKILEIDPSNGQAGKSIRRLEPLAAVKREKMKEEMMGKSFLSFSWFLLIFVYLLFCLCRMGRWYVECISCPSFIFYTIRVFLISPN